MVLKTSLAVALEPLLGHEEVLATMDTAMRFDLRQIKRAAELGIGVASASEIDLIPADEVSVPLCDTLRTILSRG